MANYAFNFCRRTYIPSTYLRDDNFPFASCGWPKVTSLIHGPLGMCVLGSIGQMLADCVKLYGKRGNNDGATGRALRGQIHLSL